MFFKVWPAEVFTSQSQSIHFAVREKFFSEKWLKLAIDSYLHFDFDFIWGILIHKYTVI